MNGIPDILIGKDLVRVVEPSLNDTTSYKSSDWQDVSVWNSSLFKTIRPLNKTQGDDQDIEKKKCHLIVLTKRNFSMMKQPRLLVLAFIKNDPPSS